jgi:hypothetical protein
LGGVVLFEAASVAFVRIEPLKAVSVGGLFHVNTSAERLVVIRIRIVWGCKPSNPAAYPLATTPR